MFLRLWIISLVVFTLVIIVFYGIANYTYTGIVTENAYQKGLDFNKINQSSIPKPDASIKATISILDTEVTVVLNSSSIESIEAKLIRPVSAKFDSPLLLTRTSEGHYTSILPALEAGEWEIRLRVFKNSTEFVFNKRFFVSNHNETP